MHIPLLQEYPDLQSLSLPHLLPGTHLFVVFPWQIWPIGQSALVLHVHRLYIWHLSLQWLDAQTCLGFRHCPPSSHGSDGFGRFAIHIPCEQKSFL